MPTQEVSPSPFCLRKKKTAGTSANSCQPNIIHSMRRRNIVMDAKMDWTLIRRTLVEDLNVPWLGGGSRMWDGDIGSTDLMVPTGGNKKKKTKRERKKTKRERKKTKRERKKTKRKKIFLFFVFFCPRAGWEH
jgi:hypothetical protein